MSYTAFILILLSAVLLQLGLWLWATKSRNAGWVDVGWSGGMALAAPVLLFFSERDGRDFLVFGLMAFWACRLCLHLLGDRLLGGKAEDARYQDLRRHWGAKANAKFFLFFQAQALLVPLFALPAWVVMSSPQPFPSVLDLAGLLIGFGAIAGETVADAQLARFRADPANKGKVCRQGLWRFSRHPNYFFEWLHWCAYAAWGLGATAWPLTLLGPFLMYLFLRYLTGIPHTERRSLASRGDAYRQYQLTTNMFWPWIPRKH